MVKLELIKFFMERAEELIIGAESAGPLLADDMLNEAEELLMLGANIMSRHKVESGYNKDAA